MRIILLGPPGAGKGTLAGFLKEEWDLAHVSTGDMLRAEMKDGTELGRKIKSIVESGALVPDEVVIELIEKRISSGSDTQKGFMLDGFPRTEAQAKELDKILEKIRQPIDKAIYMEASLDVVIQRLTGRRVCRQCGALFHIKNMPPQKGGVCDSCEGELYQRPDDNEETIAKRMEVYLESTKPIIAYYEKQAKLVKLNADQDSKAVQDLVLKMF